MRALVFDGKLHLDDSVPIPTPGPDEALLKIRRAGICNTDLELTAGMYGFSGILGHEFVAEVVEGPDDWLGHRVVGEINIACGRCDFCKKGIPSQCRKRDAVGIHNHPGAFAEYMLLVVRNLHRVPDTVDDDAAVFVEPLAAALQVTEAVHISPRDQVVVLGAGKLGLLVAQVLKLTGADVFVVTRRKKQQDLLNQWCIAASEIGALDPECAGIVVDCTGTAEGFVDALGLVKARGTIVLKSTYQGMPQADLTQVAVREIRIIGSRCGPFESALRLLERHLVDVESLIEARFPLHSALDAMRTAGERGTLKILLDF